MDDNLVTPAQLRAARALLGWSQEFLAQCAGVGLSTVKDAESGKRAPIASNIRAIRQALEGGGAKFIPADGDGPGVRLSGRRPEVVRRPSRLGPQGLTFRIAWRNQKVVVIVQPDALDDLDRTNHRTERDYLASFRLHEILILEVVAKAVDAGRVDEEGTLVLGPADFAL